MTSLSCPKISPGVYKPRRPEKTVLYEVIRRYYRTWVRKSEQSDKKIPPYVHKEFKSYIKCGILSYGFACAHCHACHKDFLLAFSCKARGVCSSCCAKNMVQIAAHLQENVIPQIPIRQWVISFPKRIRYYLQTDDILQKVLRIVANQIKKKVIACSPKVPDVALEFGAVSFIQRFGNALNLHPHFHFIVADGVFEKSGNAFNFHEVFLTEDNIVEVQDQIQLSVLKLLKKRGWIDNEEMEKMLGYENSGFSLDAKVKIPSWDRESLEKLIRYCARPSFVSENLRWNGPWLIYLLPKPCHTGKTYILLDPLEFLDKIAALIPPPRRHRHHYHGVFAPNYPFRPSISKAAIETPIKIVAIKETAEKTSKVSLNWTKLIARIYETNPLLCSCGKEMKISRIVTNPTEIWKILTKIGWPTTALGQQQRQNLTSLRI